jgi:quinohemoprotein ethanol dehydrogenase
MRISTWRVLACIAAGALLFPTSLGAQPVPAARPTADDLRNTVSGGNDWITYGGALNNQRYSTLDQINTANVSQLRGAWLTRLGSGRGSKYRFEADPLVIDGIMYIPTGNDDIFALDAKTGKKLWEYFSDIPQVNDLICCGWDNRGVAVGEGMVFSGQLDSTVVGLDQKTGQIVWKIQLEDYHDGYSITGATRYFDGLVFTGMSGAENGVRGRLHALDAKTGREVWRFYTIPAPGQIGGDTWPSPNDPDPVKRDAYLHGGGTVWQGPAIDAELGMIYFSTANAGPDNDGSVRPGDNLFTASIVALDYKTGQYRWHLQEAHHDIWDFDAPSPVVLFDQVYNGQMRKGIYQAGKTGWLYFLDRATGQPLIGITEQPVQQDARQATAATQPIPVGDRFVPDCVEPMEGFPLAGCLWTPFWDVPVLLQYSSGAGSNWYPTAYSKQTGYVYVMGNGPRPSATSVKPEPYTPGKRYFAGNVLTPPGAELRSTFTAMDSRTNTIVWQKREQGDASLGALATAGGLVFRGRVDGHLEALDARTGDLLWEFQTGWGISAPPMTYAVNGQQYVAVASGGNRGGLTTLDGDAVWGFSLNGTIDEVASPGPIQTKAVLGGRQVRIGEPIGTPTDIGGDRLFDGTLDMADYYFLPLRVAVPAGTTLNWRNTGAVIHTATSGTGAGIAWDTGDIAAGQSGSVTLDTPGTYNYNCTPHPWMLGQVVVQ